MIARFGASASSVMFLCACAEPAPERTPASSTEEIATAAEVVASGVASAEAPWRPLDETERRALCRLQTKKLRAPCVKDEQIEKLLDDTCATDGPVWHCASVTAADFAACWGTDTPKGGINAACQALEAKMTACGVPDRIRKECPMFVRTVTAGSPADKAGLIAGDRIVELDEKPWSALDDLQRYVRDSGGKPLRLRVRRSTEETVTSVAPEKDDQGAWKIGVGFGRPPECPFLSPLWQLPCQLADREPGSP